VAKSTLWGDISTESLTEIEKVLVAAFTKRVQDAGEPVKRPQMAKSV
jgi:hypothetical protein